MPIYFGPVSPSCPISQDSATGPNQAHEFNRPVFVRPTVPPARDLKSALISANLMRNIVQSHVFMKTINNVKNNVKQQKGGGKNKVGKDKFKNKTGRWKELKEQRVKKKYKYYATLPNGEKDKSSYATVERIEKMVWYDKAWKEHMTWEYGKSDGGEAVADSGMGDDLTSEDTGSATV